MVLADPACFLHGRGPSVGGFAATPEEAATPVMARVLVAQAGLGYEGAFRALEVVVANGNLFMVINREVGRDRNDGPSRLRRVARLASRAVVLAGL